MSGANGSDKLVQSLRRKVAALEEAAKQRDSVRPPRLSPCWCIEDAQRGI